MNVVPVSALYTPRLTGPPSARAGAGRATASAVSTAARAPAPRVSSCRLLRRPIRALVAWSVLQACSVLLTWFVLLAWSVIVAPCSVCSVLSGRQTAAGQPGGQSPSPHPPI